MRNFHSLEAVDRGSETQLPMGGNIKIIKFGALTLSVQGPSAYVRI